MESATLSPTGNDRLVGDEAVLLIDDDAGHLRSVERAIIEAGFRRTIVCNDSRDAVRLVVESQPGVILLDLVMPHVTGEELLAEFKVQAPQAPVIVVSATDQIESVVQCMKLGAYDYLTKPIDFDRLVACMLRATQARRLLVENMELKRRVVSPRLSNPDVFSRIITESPGMLAVFSYAETIARSSEPALIVGETGVGKELIAQAIHLASGRQGELVAVNVAGLDDTAFTDTLFGHTPGAFTGASKSREGLVERAAGGTLFLDEIGDLKIEMQTKLLRLMQEREYMPLGSDRPRRTDCRVITATNRDLRVRMRDGLFREDLYYRLHAHVVRVPPLRERRGDIPLLVEYFLDEAARALGRPRATPPRELDIYLAGYYFPGNVRELRAMVFEAAMQHEKGVLSLRTFLEHMNMTDDLAAAPRDAGALKTEGLAFGEDLPTLKGATAMLLREALRRTQGNQTAAARLLGISRRTMNRYFTSGLIGEFPGESTDVDDPANG